jgi:membrane associated rhomboid family serine protease
VIPLRDLNPTRSFPALTYLLIAANTLVFLHQVSLGDAAGELFVRRYGMVPAYLAVTHHPGSLITPFTSMFMHGGWLHLIGNMWSLYIFGDNVEDVLGKVRFALFYVLCGLGAALAQILIDPSSTMPMVGASGAIAGVLGAYFKLFPRARVVTLIPVFIFFVTRELPAWFFIILWFALNVLSGVGSLADGAQGGIAFFAHIGGFIAGFWLIMLMRKQYNPTRGFAPRGPYH